MTYTRNDRIRIESVTLNSSFRPHSNLQNKFMTMGNGMNQGEVSSCVSIESWPWDSSRQAGAPGRRESGGWPAGMTSEANLYTVLACLCAIGKGAGAARVWWGRRGGERTDGLWPASRARVAAPSGDMGAAAPARAVGLRPLQVHDSLAYLFGVGAGGSRGLLRGRVRGPQLQ